MVKYKIKKRQIKQTLDFLEALLMTADDHATIEFSKFSVAALQSLLGQVSRRYKEIDEKIFKKLRF